MRSWACDRLLSWLCCCVILVAGTRDNSEPELCDRAQNKCVSRIGCGMALHSYYINCGELIHGETDQCSPRCKKALISLLSTDDQEGKAFMECDCAGNDFCQTHRERMDVCSKDVMAAMRNVLDDHTDIGCSLAEMICRADTTCMTALDYYQLHCQKLFRGEKCTARCNNSLSILYRQTKARKLRTCICDGEEDYPCPEMQDNVERLCFARETRARRIKPRDRHRHRHRHRNHTRSGDVNIRNRQNNQEDSYEETEEADYQEDKYDSDANDVSAKHLTSSSVSIWDTRPLSLVLSIIPSLLTFCFNIQIQWTPS